ncbi:MAG: 3'-5' exonuclease, partial [Planctomycetota bacterium]|nr:3'-5' exonuclease [Planctomycetota bacterium]
QSELVAKTFNGPARVLGGAGTGKTVVAIHRVKVLAARYENEGEILFTSFSRNLAENLSSQLKDICGPLFSKVKVGSLDSVAMSLASRLANAPLKLAKQKHIAPAWEKAVKELGDEGHSLGWLQDEFSWFHSQLGLTSKADYLKTKRKGRGRMSRAKRLAVWKIFDAFRGGLRDRLLWSDIHRMAREFVAREGAPYRCVVVDEAQDMSGEQLRLIRSLAPENKDDIFLAGDAHQRIWRTAIPFRSCGLNVVGRSRKLKVNYRTTEQIRRFAVQSIEGCVVDDLDDGDDSKEGCLSLRMGEAPALRGFDTTQQELDFVVGAIKSLIEASHLQDSSLAILARGTNDLAPYSEALMAAGLKVRQLGLQDESDGGPGVRLSTMHRAKGLEFIHVFLVRISAKDIPSAYVLSKLDESQREAFEQQERTLLYVAGTRAREGLTVTWHGKPSKFLSVGSES